MRLLDVSTIEFREFIGSNIPAYAILSHTWGDEEVSFRDMRNDREAARHTEGFRKIQYCCNQAAADGLGYAWVDSCCIDKRSSAELSEAINSMFKWYQKSQVCYVYLSDINDTPELRRGNGEGDDPLLRSRWFTRGWTLQELLAPSSVQFFSQSWSLFGTKSGESGDVSFVTRLSAITGIPSVVLQCHGQIRNQAVAWRMSWASRRQTTREEDVAYSLMGLFDVNMPILYGEGGEKAFERLQHEILKESHDRTIFAWRGNVAVTSPLARSPSAFSTSSSIKNAILEETLIRPITLTNMGISITCPIRQVSEGIFLANVPGITVTNGNRYVRLWIYLKKLWQTPEGAIFYRIRTDTVEEADLDNTTMPLVTNIIITKLRIEGAGN
jgi:hypothetical protein